jgi:hypothetical protein
MDPGEQKVDQGLALAWTVESIPFHPRVRGPGEAPGVLPEREDGDTTLVLGTQQIKRIKRGSLIINHDPLQSIREQCIGDLGRQIGRGTQQFPNDPAKTLHAVAPLQKESDPDIESLVTYLLLTEQVEATLQRCAPPCEVLPAIAELFAFILRTLARGALFLDRLHHPFEAACDAIEFFLLLTQVPVQLIDTLQEGIAVSREPLLAGCLLLDRGENRLELLALFRAEQ